MASKSILFYYCYKDVHEINDVLLALVVDSGQKVVPSGLCKVPNRPLSYIIITRGPESMTFKCPGVVVMEFGC